MNKKNIGYNLNKKIRERMYLYVMNLKFIS